MTIKKETDNSESFYSDKPDSHGFPGGFGKYLIYLISTTATQEMMKGTFPSLSDGKTK